MTKQDFRRLLEDVHVRMCELTAGKGEEYARSDDQLANFKRSAAEAGIHSSQVWLVFFNKHIDAIKHWVKTGDRLNPSEPIDGRIDDAILYLILLKALIDDGKTPL